MEIAEGDLGAYRRAGEYLNVSAVDLRCLQHENGIFGGKAGSYVLALLRQLRMPIVTTLHTICVDAPKVGLSPPLIETERGWLMNYHGVRHTATGSL